MTEERMSALTDAVRDNPCGLAAVKSFDIAEKVMAYLIKSTMKPIDLLRRASGSPFKESLLVFLATHFVNSEHCFEFLDALFGEVEDFGPEPEPEPKYDARFNKFSLPPDEEPQPEPLWSWEWDVRSKKEEVKAIVSNLLIDSGRLLTDKKMVVKNAYHPLYFTIHPDQYWTPRVRYYIAKGDYARAFDELKKALRGVADSTRYTNIDYLRGRVRYTFNVSDKTCNTLISEFYKALQEKGFVEEVSTGQNVPFGHMYLAIAKCMTDRKAKKSAQKNKKNRK